MIPALSVTEQVISLEMNTSLTRHVSVEEIELAASQLGALKALRPDSFPGYFFRLINFFETDFLLKELNLTNLVALELVS